MQPSANNLAELFGRIFLMAGKTKRKTKTSKGIHGAGGKVRLSTLQKALLGKGMLHGC